MLRLTLLLVSVAVAFAKTNTTTVTPSPTHTTTVVHTTAVVTATTSLASKTSHVVTSTVHPTSSILPSTVSTMVPPTASANATTKPPTTTPKPTTPVPPTKPAPLYGDYSIKNKNKKYCLLAQLDATFSVAYSQKKDANTTVEAYTTLKIPLNASLVNTSESQCDKDGESKLVIMWPKVEKFYTFTMQFAAELAAENSAAKNYSSWKVTAIELTVVTDKNKLFPNATEKTLTLYSNKTELSKFSGNYNSYYQCGGNTKYDLGKKSTLKVDHVKVQPFMKASNNETFTGDYKDCEPTTPTTKPEDNNIVPIAVGCALAGLVLIVLIAYVIGRRKSQRGYEKV